MLSLLFFLFFAIAVNTCLLWMSACVCVCVCVRVRLCLHLICSIPHARIRLHVYVCLCACVCIGLLTLLPFYFCQLASALLSFTPHLFLPHLTLSPRYLSAIFCWCLFIEIAERSWLSYLSDYLNHDPLENSCFTNSEPLYTFSISYQSICLGKLNVKLNTKMANFNCKLRKFAHSKGEGSRWCREGKGEQEVENVVA